MAHALPFEPELTLRSGHRIAPSIRRFFRSRRGPKIGQPAPASVCALS